MNKYLKIILLTSGLYGISIGLYDYLFPLYLNFIGLSFEKMGWIFSLSFAFILVFRIYLGHISDFIGRKFFYGISLLAAAISYSLTPLFQDFSQLAFLKTFKEISLTVKETFQPVLVFEQSKKKFIDFYGKINGISFFLEGIGILFAGWLLVHVGIRTSLIFACIPVWIALAILIFFYKEKFVSLKERNFSPKFAFEKIPTKNAKKIIAVGFFLNLGVFISHNFILPLYFLKKFHASLLWIAAILAVHRIILGAPMLITGKLVKKHHKEVLLYGLIFEGIMLSATVFMPTLILAASIFLLHDFGAAFWQPIYQSYIQKFSRKTNRAKDTSIIFAYISIAKIIAPLITGYVVVVNLDLPFFLSGLVVILTGFMVLILPPISRNNE